MAGPRSDELSDEQLRNIEEARASFEESLERGDTRRIDVAIAQVPGEIRAPLFRILLSTEVEYRQYKGELPQSSVYEDDYPDFQDDVRAVFAEMLKGDESTQLYQRGAEPMRKKSRRPPIVQQIAGFEVLERIGKGGMGVVYKARDPRLKRFVAIKMMLAGDHADQDDFARFQLEAEAVARLQHPNIVQIFEVGEHDEHPYIALEFVDGPDLSTYVQGEPQPQRLAAELVLMLAQAMQYAHSHGIVHRDLKPANILLEGVEESSDSSVATDESTATDQPSSSGGSTVVDQVETMASTKSATRSARSRSSDSSLIQPSGERTTASGILAKITDFGLAKQLDAQSHLTATGAVVGTPQFMAPEQSAGETHAIGTAADVYSLGAILDFVITGRAPFYGASIVETLMMVRNDDPAAPTLLVPHLSKDLETICLIGQRHFRELSL
jgi:serine/threonine protein kinase